MSWIQKLASIEIMYHGSSSVLASKILSEGLVPGRELVWDVEKTKGDVRSRESYGGIYFSDNFMTAYSAAGVARNKFGGGRLIVMAQLELRSPFILMDEDKMLEPRRIFDSIVGYGASGWNYLVWAKDGMPGLSDMVEGYLNYMSRGPGANYMSKGEIVPGFEDSRQREALAPFVEELIKASVMREVAIALEEDRQSGWNRFKYEFPEFADLNVQEAESNYRSIANKFMNKSKFLTNVESGFSHNVRSLEPVSFRGSNKILLVAKMNESTFNSETGGSNYIDGKYNLEAEILYLSDSSVVGILSEDMVQRIGGGIRVRDSRNNVYFDQPREEANVA